MSLSDSGSKPSLDAGGSLPGHIVRNCKGVSGACLNTDEPNSSQAYHNHSLGINLANGGSKPRQQRLDHGGGPETDSTADTASFEPSMRRLDSDPICSSPTEVSDLILSYLSPAALDAARHTCKAWYHTIMSNRWVLSHVLGMNRGSSHRDLLKALEIDSTLLSTFQHPDGWRTSFRIRDVQFLLPVSSSWYVSATRIGSECGFMVFHLSNERPMRLDQTKSTLVFYRFDPTDLPLYAGCAEHEGTEGAINISYTTKVEPGAPTLFKVNIGGITRLYTIATRKAFSNCESRFSLVALGSPDEAQKSRRHSEDLVATAQSSYNDETPSSNSSQSWNVFARLPPNRGFSHVGFVDGVSMYVGSRFLAEQVHSGDFFVVQEIFHSHPNLLLKKQHLDPKQDQVFVGKACLSRPKRDSVYRKVAVAPAFAKNRTIRVAIIWQTPNAQSSRSELDIYDVPEAVNCESCQTSSEGVIPDQPYLVVQGKRISSLTPYMGGMHICSPLWGQDTCKEAALGGLQLLHTIEAQENYPRDVQYLKCFVWGPAEHNKNCTQINCKVFDFSFADPKRLLHLISDGVRTRHSPEGRQYMTPLSSIHCNCALHDDGFRIVLPDTTIIPAKASSEEARKSSFWPWKGVFPRQEFVDIGSVVRDDPPARREALERQKEWLRFRIREMRRRGISDFEIAELRGCSRWTQYGQLGKPDGWRES